MRAKDADAKRLGRKRRQHLFSRRIRHYSGQFSCFRRRPRPRPFPDNPTIVSLSWRSSLPLAAQAGSDTKRFDAIVDVVDGGDDVDVAGEASPTHRSLTRVKRGKLQTVSRIDSCVEAAAAAQPQRSGRPAGRRSGPRGCNRMGAIN